MYCEDPVVVLCFPRIQWDLLACASVTAGSLEMLFFLSSGTRLSDILYLLLFFFISDPNSVATSMLVCTFSVLFCPLYSSPESFLSRKPFCSGTWCIFQLELTAIQYINCRKPRPFHSDPWSLDLTTSGQRHSHSSDQRRSGRVLTGRFCRRHSLLSSCFQE